MSLRLNSRREESPLIFYEEPERHVIEILEYEASASDSTPEDLYYVFDKFFELYSNREIVLPKSVIYNCCKAHNSFFMQTFIEYCERNNISAARIDWRFIIMEILKMKAYDIFDVVYYNLMDKASSVVLSTAKSFIKIYGGTIKDVDSFCDFIFSHDFDLSMADFGHNACFHRFIKNLLMNCSDKTLAFRMLDYIKDFKGLDYNFYSVYLVDMPTNILTYNDLLKLFDYASETLCSYSTLKALCHRYWEGAREDLLGVLVVHCNGGTSVSPEFISCVESLLDFVSGITDIEPLEQYVEIANSVDKKGIVASLMIEEAMVSNNVSVLKTLFSNFDINMSSCSSFDLLDTLAFYDFNDMSESIAYLIHTGQWDKQYWIRVFEVLSDGILVENAVAIIENINLTDKEKKYLRDYVIKYVYDEDNRNKLLMTIKNKR